MIVKVKFKNSSIYSEKDFTNPKCDYIDLRASKDFEIKGPTSSTLKSIDGEKKRAVNMNYYRIPLGICMELPKGMIAIVKERSSTSNKFGITMTSSGVIDNSYNGDDDEWQFGCVSIKDGEVKEGDRICQFTVVPSMNASFWQKLKWFFTPITFKFVDYLGNKNRGGHGSTGIK